MDNEKVLNWFYSLDNERQNELMYEADSDPADQKFYDYLLSRFYFAIKKFNNQLTDK